MRVHVARVPRPNVDESLEVPVGSSVRDVLRILSLPVDAVVVLRDGTPLPSDAAVAQDDRLRVVNVFSGG